MKTVAIIPARGGSKGIKRKNLQRVGGVSLVERAIRSAAASARIDTVVVSTDDDEIAAVSLAAGAVVIRRPADLAGDTATSESAVLHALHELAARGESYDAVAFLQATSPFTLPDSVDEAVAMIAEDQADSVFSAFETYGFLWARDAETGTAQAINHDAAYRPRRQDREPHYLETGAFYVFRAAGFRESQHRFFGRIRCVEVPEWSAIEIDDEHQLAVARALAVIHTDAGQIPAQAVVTDFDGVHTDDTALLSADGSEHVKVSREDGMGVSLLRTAGIPMLILSTETNPIVRARANKLKVEVLHGIDDKATALRKWAGAKELELQHIAYLGNDVNDLAAMSIVGWPIAVANAHPDVLAAARIVLRKAGGQGAVRELVERVLPG